MYDSKQYEAKTMKVYDEVGIPENSRDLVFDTKVLLEMVNAQEKTPTWWDETVTTSEALVRFIELDELGRFSYYAWDYENNLDGIVADFLFYQQIQMSPEAREDAYAWG